MKKLKRSGTSGERRVWLSRKRIPCPLCGQPAPRHSTRESLVRELGVIGPVIIRVTQSVHFCKKCKKYFSTPRPFVLDSSKYTHRVRAKALSLYESGLTLEKVSATMYKDYFITVPCTTVFDWSTQEAYASAEK